jgi:hypothetical protein
MKMQSQVLRNIPKQTSEVLGYQHDGLIQRYMMDYGVSADHANRCFRALKEFMVVCAVKPGYKVTSDPIDRMWHTFLLFTKDYKEFCEDNLGVFINHEPFEHAAPEAYIETRAFAEKYFGNLDGELWSVQAKADCSSGCAE